MAGPTQFKSTDTRRWWLGYGSGVDGDLTISGNTTEAPIDSACTGTATQTSLSATNASFAVGQAILIHQTQGTGAGQWELGYITGYTAGTITLKDALYYTYTTGAQVRVLKQYKNVTIDTGVTYTAKAWNGTVGGILAFLANGTVSVVGTITAAGTNGVNNAGLTDGNYQAGSSGGGFRGGKGNRAQSGESHVKGWAGEGTTGASAESTEIGANMTYSGGGGASYNNSTISRSGAGGANVADGQAGTAAEKGLLVSTASFTTMNLGGGGGGGGRGYNCGTGAAGGASGGGIILIISKNITVSGTISAKGGNAGINTNTSGQASEGGASSSGGGGGGSILIKTQVSVLGTSITAAGGTGSGASGGLGGAGGAGGVHLDYAASTSGTTTPTLDATQDLTLRQPIKRRMII